MSVHFSSISFDELRLDDVLAELVADLDGVGHRDEHQLVRAAHHLPQQRGRVGQVPQRGPVPDELEAVVRERQRRPILRQDELRGQPQLAPDALDAGQTLGVVVDQRDRAS